MRCASLVLSWVLFLSLFDVTLLTVIIIIITIMIMMVFKNSVYFISIITLFFSQPMSFTFFPILLPIPPGQGRGKE